MRLWSVHICRYDVFPDIMPVAEYAEFGRRQLSDAQVPPCPTLRSGALV